MSRVPTSTGIVPRTALLGALTAAMAISATVASAADGEVCVECDAPVASYACRIDNAESLSQFRGGARAIELLCISDIAKSGNHGKCSTRRNAGACTGTPHVVSLKNAARALIEQHVTTKPGVAPVPAAGPAATRPGLPPPSNSAGGSQAATSGSDTAAPAGPGTQPGAGRAPGTAQGTGTSKPPTSEPPRTMKELAERTLDSSGSGIKSAGDKVADGFKKSWTCVTSLFQKCD